ncbi:MAG: tetratricopeptide repeat protein, partial [Myxococcota bacterium]
PKPKPKPAPKAEAAPTPPKTTSSTAKANFRSLVNRAWAETERNPTLAIESFEAALKLRPSDPDAVYGLGYALLKANRTSEANVQLCRALRNSPARDIREIEGILNANNLSCK